MYGQVRGLHHEGGSRLGVLVAFMGVAAPGSGAIESVSCAHPYMLGVASYFLFVPTELEVGGV